MGRIWGEVSRSIARVLPETLKARLKGLRSRYARLVYGFGPEDLRIELDRVGVVPQDVLMVHCSFGSFEGFRGTPAIVIRTLQRAVGPGGTILMPTLPFGGSVVDYAATEPLFDVHGTVSQTGLVSEVFRRSPQVLRSLHPTHSVAAWGAKASELIAGHEVAGTPCGRATPWGRLLEHDGKILLLGVPIEAMTFFHAVEEALESELPVPLFQPGEYALQCRDEGGTTRVAKTRLYSRRLAGRRDVTPLAKELQSRDAWREARVGRLRLILLRARDTYDAVADLTKRGVSWYHL